MQFRPISLCNVIYKIIAKVIVGRMSGLLKYCIDEAQWAFIPSRQISDNVLVFYEWDFLAGTMTKLGLHADRVTLVMRFVCSVFYTVGVNDAVSDRFWPSRGLQQCVFFCCVMGVFLPY
ncbi:reverse transcriptase [Gossypium australe]|uniref:Reverse transcriptase n=1 Tax=Gossypium australe TaxID=47621 RepID=A0A5B6WQ34_9ROSI|nr:reverse transcriptase [Gossypium australe]